MVEKKINFIFKIQNFDFFIELILLQSFFRDIKKGDVSFYKKNMIGSV